MNKWIISENKKKLNYIGNPAVEQINGRIVKIADGYNAFVAENFVGSYKDVDLAKAIIEKSVSEKIYEAGLRDLISHGIESAKDRFALALGSKDAEGRIQLRTGTKRLMDDWATYCGREKAAGNARPSVAPTLTDLADFFNSEYRIRFSPKQLQKMAGAGGNQNVPDTNAKTDQAEINPDKLKVLGYISSQITANKFNGTIGDNAQWNLKAKKGAKLPDIALQVKKGITKGPDWKLETVFKKSENPATPVGESIIKEDGPEDITFDPKTLFPVLANQLIKLGILKVSDQQGNIKDDPYDKEGLETALENEEFSGITVDMNKYSKFLQANGVKSAETMKDLVSQFNSGIDPKSDAARYAFTIIACFAMNVVDADSIDKKKNITATNHTINMKKLAKLLQNNGISLKYITQIKQKLKSVPSNDRIKYLTDNIIGDDKDSIKKAIKLAKSISNSIVTVDKNKKQETPAQ